MHPEVKPINLQIDDTVALSYIVKMGETKLDFIRHKQRYLGLLAIKGDHNYCRVPGVLNEKADFRLLSMNDSSKKKMTLQRKVDARHQSLCTSSLPSASLLYFLETRSIQQE